jgi:hypothetical protein
MLQPSRIEMATLDDAGPICKMCKLPQTRAVHFLAACSVRKFPLAETVPVEQICSYSHPSLLKYHALAPSVRADWVHINPNSASIGGFF